MLENANLHLAQKSDPSRNKQRSKKDSMSIPPVAHSDGVLCPAEIERWPEGSLKNGIAWHAPRKFATKSIAVF